MGDFKLRDPFEQEGFTMENIENVIAESKDLVTALESVAVMYGVPSTNILEDMDLKSIKVVGDHILCPSDIKETTGNTKAIIQSIGAVMDYISQRVDDKLTKYHKEKNCCDKEDHIAKEANPAKGHVIARHVDSNGDEIIVYDTGLTDTPMTKEARDLYDHLKASGLIPELKSVEKKSTYFSDADDITQGVDMNVSTMNAATIPNSNLSEANLNELSQTVNTALNNASSSNETVTSDAGVSETDIASSINESYETLSTIAAYNNTRNLGYDMLTKNGFDYVKPVTFMESATEESSNTSAEEDKQSPSSLSR